jgi:serine/threonine protein kinase
MNDAKQIFLAALERSSPQDLASYLDRACADNAALRSRVEELLCAHQNAQGFLLAEWSSPAGDNAQLLAAVGTLIGPYKLCQLIGEGGMGVVYAAEQAEPIKRTVALKIIKPGMDSRQVISRFDAERQALAMMDHPNVAKILDAGTTATGQPYFVMELVNGIPIVQYCDEHRLTPRLRLSLFLTVCQAVQHAHQKGIIHRDLKPTNILVAEYDDRPVVKIIDFGVAKAMGQELSGRTMFTEIGQVVGTIEYMSPEQAKLNQLDIDTRTDIYSLGVLLYELLTGETPFDRQRLRSAAFDEMLRIVREEEPPKPSQRLDTTAALATIAENRGLDPKQLAGFVRGDLDWIALKALEKDRTRRYESASSLATDIERYLSNEPVEACPPTRVYRFKKLVYRNKLACFAAAAVLSALTLGLGLSTWLFIRERAERLRAIAAEQLAQANEQKSKTAAVRSEQVTAFMKEMLAGVEPSMALGRDTTMLREILDQTAQKLDKNLTDQPEVEADLRYTLAGVYESLQDWPKAESMSRRALELRKQLFHGEYDDLVDAQLRLGYVLVARHNARQYSEAESLLREALANSEKLHRDQDVAKAESLWKLAEILRSQYKLREAESLARESLTMLTKGDKTSDECRSAALATLANVLRAEFKLSDAEVVQREDVELDRQLLGSDDPQLITPLHNLGSLLLDENKISESVDVLREALALNKKYRPEENPAYASLLSDLGGALQEQGQLSEAEDVDRRALTIYKKFRARDWQIDDTWTNLIDLLRRQDRLSDLDATYRDVEEYERDVDKTAFPEVATSPEELGARLMIRHRSKDAEKLESDVLPLLKSEYGHDSEHVAVSLYLLGEALSAQGKNDAVEAPCTEAVEIFKQIDSKTRYAGNARNRLALILRAHNKLSEAEGLHREAISILRAAEGNNTRDIASALRSLARILQRQGKIAESESTLREAVEAERRFHGGDNPEVAEVLFELACMLAGEKKLPEAESMLRETLAMRQKFFKADDRILSMTLSRLNDVLQSEGKPPEASTLVLQKAVAQPRPDRSAP